MSFPPWWQRRVKSAPMVMPRKVQDDTTPAKAAMSNAAGPNNAPANARWKPFEVDPVKGQVEVTVDAAGQVFLRGVVASEEVRREIEERGSERSGRHPGRESVPGSAEARRGRYASAANSSTGAGPAAHPDRGPKAATPAAVQAHPRPAAMTKRSLRTQSHCHVASSVRSSSVRRRPTCQSKSVRTTVSSRSPAKYPRPMRP